MMMRRLLLLLSAAALLCGSSDAARPRKGHPAASGHRGHNAVDSKHRWDRHKYFEQQLQYAKTVLGENPENPCAGKSRAPDEPFTFFLVLFMGRSGSSAFMSEVAQHDQVFVPGYEPWNTHKSDPLPLTLNLLMRFVDDSIVAAHQHGCRAMGFKFRLNRLTLKVLEQNRDRWSPLVLEQARWNILGLAISGYSHYVGATTQFGRSRNRGPAPPLQITDWDVFHEEVRTAIETSDNLRAGAGYLGAEAIFYYEEYLLKHAQAMTRFFSMIRVDPEQHNTSFVAGASSVVLCERVANYQELCDRFWCHTELNHHFLVDVWFGCTCAPVPVCGEPAPKRKRKPPKKTHPSSAR